MKLVTKNGYEKPTFGKIRSFLEQKIKEYYPQGLNLGENSNVGRMLSINSLMFSAFAEALEFLYLSGDISSASGVYLDRLVALRDITRLSATHTTILAVLSGVDGTLIPKHSFVAQPESEVMFLNEKQIKLTHTQSYTTTLLLRSFTEGEKIAFALNGQEISYTAKAKETIKNVFVEVANLIVLSGIPVNVVQDVENALLTLKSKSQKNEVCLDNLTASWKVQEVSVIGLFHADRIGSFFASADSVTEIKTPVFGWDKVSNPFGSLVGRELESDQDLRQRLPTATVKGLATDIAIENQVMKVEGVSTARCISNRTNKTDTEGRPPKSFEVIVIGGEDQAVGEMIFKSQPAGIESFGNTAVTVEAPYGDALIQKVKFSRPETKLLAIEITIDPYTEEGQLPFNYEFLVKKALIEFSAKEYTLGKDVIRERLFVPLYASMNGLGSLTIKVGLAEDTNTFPSVSLENIPIKDREIVVLNAKLIKVLLK